MDFNHLRSFVTVAQTGHLTRAAETLHLSQPAVSSHIKTLEEQFGVPLFERSPSGMTLTPSGRRLLAEAEQIIGAVQRLEHSALDLRGQPTGHLKLGTVLDPAVLRVGDLMRGALERYPQMELELFHVMSSDALARVRGGTLDASFYFGALPDADLNSVALRDIVYRVTVPAAWGEKLRDATWETVAEQPWIVAPEPSSHRQLVMELFRDRIALPERIIEADNESVINNLVESGVGVSLIRDEVAAQSSEAGRSAIWPGLRVTTQLWFVYPVARSADPLLVAILDVLGAVWADGRDAGTPPAATAEMVAANRAADR
jgi:DNA-binding transcriptional LysR family regulator